jgi:hypothetical protein
MTKTFMCYLKGAMTHSADLSNDSFGSITRINNALEKIPDRLRASEAQLETTLSQFESAKNEIGKPFAYEAEFNEKTARLVELDALLSMDDKPDADGQEQGAEEQACDAGGQAGRTPDVDGHRHGAATASDYASQSSESDKDEAAKSTAFSGYVKLAADRKRFPNPDRAAAVTKDTGVSEQNRHRKKTRDAAR